MTSWPSGTRTSRSEGGGVAEREEISLLAEVQRLAANEPFVPFSIVMASGSRYDISEADVLAFGRNVISLFALRKATYLLRSSEISEVVIPGGEP